MSLQGELFVGKKKVFVVTPSMISEYLRCPLRYKYIYIDGRKEKITKFYFRLGAMIHNLLTCFIKTPSSLQTFETLKELLSEKWKSEWFDTSEEEKEWFDRAIVMLKNFYHSHLSFKLKNFALELPFEVKIEDTDIVLKGRIDRVVQDLQGNYHIIEYKIGHEEVAEDISMMEKNYQPIFYFLGLHNNFGLRAESFKYFFLLNNQTLTIQYTDSMLNKGIKELKNIIQEIRETKNYLPKENIYCQDCVFPCPLKSKKSFSQKIIKNRNKKPSQTFSDWA
ncbi:PD-(D/E)XK nuclease family protein [bacterium]|nr:PD-(D/E)XK nuclease family protein [bacterium]